MVSSVRKHGVRKKGSANKGKSRKGGGAAVASANGVASTNGHSANGYATNGESNGHSHGVRRGGMSISVLALNRNFAAVHVISVQRAFCLLWKETAEVIDLDGGHYMTYNFDGWRENSELKQELEVRDDSEDWIRAVNFEIQVPRIIRLLRYDRIPRNAVKYNRRNIFLRDEHRCQYCQKRFNRQQLSLDHVMPRSRGGQDSWENIVCACLTCNVRKGGRTPKEAGMSLMKPPVKPKRSPLISRQLTETKYESWSRFLHTGD